ncbi:MAG: hypothetical protein AAGG81_09095, partial [Chlamydiota bacterium]
MSKLTPVSFSIEWKNGVTYGGFAIDETSLDRSKVDEVFGSLEKQQPEGIKIKHNLIQKQSKDQCDKDGIDQLNSKEKIEGLLKETLASL